MATKTQTKSKAKARAPYLGVHMRKTCAKSKEEAERNVEIINKWASGKYPNQTALAAEYGVSQTVVSMIICNPNSTYYE